MLIVIENGHVRVLNDFKTGVLKNVDPREKFINLILFGINI